MQSQLHFDASTISVHYVAEVLRYRGDLPLWDWLDRSGHWPKGQTKPADPKGTVEYVLHDFRTKLD